MRLAVLSLLCIIAVTSAYNLVDSNQEEELITVLKKWKSVYDDGIKAKEEVIKRDGQAQQQTQSQTVSNSNQVNIHLNQLGTTVHHYHYYGRRPMQKPKYKKPKNKKLKNRKPKFRKQQWRSPKKSKKPGRSSRS